MQVIRKNMFIGAATLVAVATAIALTSCSGKQTEDKQLVNENEAKKLADQSAKAKQDGKLTEANRLADEAADTYARMGELMMMPDAFMYADGMFDKALALQPNHPKAAIYKAFTGPLMTMRGFVTRIEPVVRGKRSAEDLAAFRNEILKQKLPELTSFALDIPAGKSAFNNYYSLQRYLRDELLPAILDGFNRLEQIKLNAPVKLNLIADRLSWDLVRTERSYSEKYHSCYQNPSDQSWSCWDYTYNGNDSSSKFRREQYVDQYDLTILKRALIGAADHLRFFTAYSFRDAEPAIQRLSRILKIKGQITVQDLTSVLGDFRNLLTLEKDNQLPELRNSLSDSLRSVIELADMEQYLCRSGARSVENSLFFPICIAERFKQSLMLSLDALAGPQEIILGYDANQHPVMIKVDLSRVLTSPVTDLKSLLPTDFDENGDATQFSDPSFNGLFPNRDFIGKIKRIRRSHLLNHREYFGLLKSVPKHLKKALR